jgi:hypothetical protein
MAACSIKYSQKQSCSESGLEATGLRPERQMVLECGGGLERGVGEGRQGLRGQMIKNHKDIISTCF